MSETVTEPQKDPGQKDGRVRPWAERLAATDVSPKVQRTIRGLVFLICAVGTIAMLGVWHGQWEGLQTELSEGGFCVALAERIGSVGSIEAVALGFAGLSFAVVPVVLFSKSTIDLVGLLLAVLSAIAAFMPAELIHLEGGLRVTTVISLGVFSLAVFILAWVLRRAVALDVNKKEDTGRRYAAGFWRLLPFTLGAVGVIVMLTVVVPLSGPLVKPDSSAQRQVNSYMSSLNEHDTTRCGGGLTEPEPGPTKG